MRVFELNFMTEERRKKNTRKMREYMRQKIAVFFSLSLGWYVLRHEFPIKTCTNTPVRP